MFLFSLNAVREVSARCPLAMTEDLLQDLVLYKKSKDKSECHSFLNERLSCFLTFITSFSDIHFFRCHYGFSISYTVVPRRESNTSS